MKCYLHTSSIPWHFHTMIDPPTCWQGSFLHYFVLWEQQWPPEGASPAAPSLYTALHYHNTGGQEMSDNSISLILFHKIRNLTPCHFRSCNHLATQMLLYREAGLTHYHLDEGSHMVPTWAGFTSSCHTHGGVQAATHRPFYCEHWYNNTV